VRYAWVSFRNPADALWRGNGQSLGVAILQVDVDVDAPLRDFIVAALRRAWRGGFNPGGEATAYELAARHWEMIPRSFRGRLLSMEEATELNTLLAALKEADQCPS
jgi:hypothetical protein